MRNQIAILTLYITHFYSTHNDFRGKILSKQTPRQTKRVKQRRRERESGSERNENEQQIRYYATDSQKKNLESFSRYTNRYIFHFMTKEIFPLLCSSAFDEKSEQKKNKLLTMIKKIRKHRHEETQVIQHSLLFSRSC